MVFKIEGKEMYPILFSQCSWPVHSKVVRLSKHAHSKQRKATPTQSLQFHVKLCACPANSASIECIFSTYGLVWSNIRNSLDPEKAEKLVKINRIFQTIRRT